MVAVVPMLILVLRYPVLSSPHRSVSGQASSSNVDQVSTGFSLGNVLTLLLAPVCTLPFFPSRLCSDTNKRQSILTYLRKAQVSQSHPWPCAEPQTALVQGDKNYACSALLSYHHTHSECRTRGNRAEPIYAFDYALRYTVSPLSHTSSSGSRGKSRH